MKLLHLADLHIGKIIYEQSLLEDQKYILNEIINIIKESKIEAVMISGDIYDRSIPPSDAVDVLDNFLCKLVNELKVKVFIIAGNHDSKERLNFGSKIFESEGLYIQTEYTGSIEKVCLNDSINIYMLPFIKPIEVKKYFEEDEISSYNDAIKAIMKKEKIDKKKINVLMCHQFVTAGEKEMPETCESETINVGGLENVDASNFDKFDYVALGHIHGAQRIGRDLVRYSGTMLKYSFSEVNHNKSVCIIDIKSKDDISYELVKLKPLRDMRVLKGPIKEILKEENYKGTNLEDYVKIILTDDEIVYNPLATVRTVYPNTLSLEVLNNKTLMQEKNIEQIEHIREKTEMDLFEDFYEFQNNVKLDESQKALIADVIDSVKKEVDN